MQDNRFHVVDPTSFAANPPLKIYAPDITHEDIAQAAKENFRQGLVAGAVVGLIIGLLF